MTSLESRYRRMMAAYPPDYRTEKEDEIVATLLEVAGTDRSHPTIGEAWDLISNGIAVRAASNGGDARRTGRAYAGLVACAVMSTVTALMLALWMSGFYPSTSDITFVALWAPFAVLVLWYVVQPQVPARLGWWLFAFSFAGVVAGADHTMAQRSLLLALTTLGLVMVTAPSRTAPRSSELTSRMVAMLVGVGAAVAMTVRYNAKFDFLNDRGATVLWGVLPHPPSILIPVIIAAAVGVLIASLFRPALVIAWGILVVPVGVIGFTLSSAASFLTPNRQQLFQALIVCASAIGLVMYGVVTSMRTRRGTPSLRPD